MSTQTRTDVIVYTSALGWEKFEDVFAHTIDADHVWISTKDGNQHHWPIARVWKVQVSTR